jgi:hypothetical protein
LILNPRLKLAETAAKIINEDSLLTVSNESPRDRGGQEKADSEAKVATRINVSQQTLNRDKQFNHAAARAQGL